LIYASELIVISLFITSSRITRPQLQNTVTISCIADAEHQGAANFPTSTFLTLFAQRSIVLLWTAAFP
jgi:hypothetical protein